MPSFLKRPYYQFGRPLQAREVIIEGESIEKIYFRYAERKETFIYKYIQSRRRKKDEEILKGFLIYYLNAPGFDLTYMRNKQLDKISFEDLLEDCFDVGIDPF